MVLYKYFCPERKSFLSELLIRFTSPGDFNDPFDSLPAFSGFDEQLIKQRVGNVFSSMALKIDLETLSEEQRRIKRAFLDRASADVLGHYLSNPSALDEGFLALHRKRINAEIGVLCLSANPNSIVMWSHYAKNHKGFVIGFESEDSFFSHHSSEPPDIGVLREVVYMDKRPYVDLRQIKPDGDLPEFLFVKNREWSYEREWRIIRFLSDAEVTKDGAIRLLRVPPSAIREVIFGCRTETSTADTLRSSIRENSNLSHVKLFNAALSKSHYQMEILPSQ